MKRVLGCWCFVVLALGCGGNAANKVESPKSGDAKKDEAALKPWAEVTKDTTAQAGFITVRVGRDGTTMFELSPGQLDTDLGLALHISQGAGDLMLIDGLSITDGMLVRFHRVGNKVYFVQRNTNFTADPGSPMETSMEGNRGDSIVGVLPVLSEHEESKAILVDASKFLASDWMKLSLWIQPAFGKAPEIPPVALDEARSFVAKSMTFPRNTEIDVTLTYAAQKVAETSFFPGLSNPFSVPVGVRYSLFALPDPPMRARFADDRVGYFTSPKYDFSRERGSTGLVELVHRWRLEKKDPQAAVSEPVQPIVYYLDRSIPVAYRGAVRDGVLAWNAAFEQAGFRNAVVVKDAPDDPDWNAEDIRYSTIRWSAAYRMGFAIGPSQADPRTGEILNADILVWSEFIRTWYERDYQEMAAATPSALGRGALAHAGLCAAGNGLAQSLAFQHIVLGTLGALDGGAPMPKEYLDEGIRALVMHEVGHTLGLRHNFMSSITVSFDQLHDAKFTAANGVTGSVMDYTPVNVAAPGEPQAAFYSTVVGPYDKWAIEYGYRPVDGDTPDAERPALAAIAGRSNEPALAYATDEDTLDQGYTVDPRSSRFDLGSDPVAYAEERIALVDAVLPRLAAKLVADGESYDRLRIALADLLGTRYGALRNAIKPVGGMLVSRNHKGDPGERAPIVPVDAAWQRRAVELLVKRGFAADAAPLPAELLELMAPSRAGDFGSDLVYVKPTAVDLPIHEVVLRYQKLLLDELLAPARLARMVDNEVRVPAGQQPYRLEEMLTALTDGIWTELLGSGGRVVIDSYRRNLQRQYADMLVTLLLSAQVPEDGRSLARLELGRIEARAKRAKTGDKTTQAHLEETVVRIRRALDASVTVNPLPAPDKSTDG